MSTTTLSRRTALAALAGAAALALAAPPARAAGGDFTYVFCSNPHTRAGVGPADGALPPGFAAHVDEGIGPDAGRARCGPGPMTLARGIPIDVWQPFTTSTPGRGAGALSFVTPPGLALERAELFLNGTTGSAANHMTFAVHGGAWNAVFGVPWALRCEWAWGCVTAGDFTDPYGEAGHVVFGQPEESGFHVTLGCTIPDESWRCTASTSAVVRVFGGRLRLRDDSAPQLTGAPFGALAGDAVLRGEPAVTLGATDAGAGLYRVLLRVDGAVVGARLVHENGGRCTDVDPADDDPYEFAAPVPCRPSAGGTFRLDTTTLPEGRHRLEVILEDAAGNATTVVDRTVTVDNVPDPAPAPDPPAGPPAPATPGPAAASGAPAGAPSAIGVAGIRRDANGDNPSDDARLTAGWARTTDPTLTTAYGLRNVVRGRLVDEHGDGIANARIEFLARRAGLDQPLLDKGGARTRADGRWTLILPAGASSRTLTFRYRSHLGDARATATRTLRLRVRAGVVLSVRRAGGALRVGGRLRGGPVPREGVVVDVQARIPGGAWATVRSVRTSAGGGFRARCRFRGQGRIELRARTRTSGAYPFAPGASRVVHVRIR